MLERWMYRALDFEHGKENFDNYIAAYDFIENSFKNERVEIVTRNGLSPYIGSRIIKEVLYDLKKE